MSNSNSSDALAVLFAGGVSILFIIFWILYAIILIAVVTILIISMWKLFVKAGQPGWASIVPIYNFWVLCDMVFNNNIMWFIFIFIPFLNFVSGQLSHLYSTSLLPCILPVAESKICISFAIFPVGVQL